GRATRPRWLHRYREGLELQGARSHRARLRPQGGLCCRAGVGGRAVFVSFWTNARLDSRHGRASSRLSTFFLFGEAMTWMPGTRPGMTVFSSPGARRAPVTGGGG